MSKQIRADKTYNGPLIPPATVTVVKVNRAWFIGISAGNLPKISRMISEDAAVELARLILEAQDSEGNVELKGRG